MSFRTVDTDDKKYVQIQADSEHAELLGASYFGHKDDIRKEDLGAFRKEYRYSTYQSVDQIVVRVYQNGAEVFNPTTGAWKLYGNIGRAFNDARALKERNYTLGRMLG